MNKDEIRSVLETRGRDAASAYMALPSFNPGFRLAAKSEFGRAFNRYMSGLPRDVRYINRGGVGISKY